MANKFASALRNTRQTAAPTPTVRSSNERSMRKHIGGYFYPDVSTQLRHLAVEENSTVQQLLAEALDLLFQARGKPVIARERRPR